MYSRTTKILVPVRLVPCINLQGYLLLFIFDVNHIVVLGKNIVSSPVSTAKNVLKRGNFRSLAFHKEKQ